MFLSVLFSCNALFALSPHAITVAPDLDVLMVVIQTNYNPCVAQVSVTATANATGGTVPYSYHWDTGANTVSVTFNQNGTHSVTVTDANGATATTSVDIILNGQAFSIGIHASKDTICSGDNTTLSASGDPATSYHWSPGGATTSSITVHPAATTTYQLAAIRSSTVNIVQNGNFSAGNTGFFTDYALGAGGQYGPLTLEGTYGVGANPKLLHNNFATCGDHTTGSGNMLVVNGASNPNVNVWCQTVTVAPNTEYMFSTWLASVTLTNPAVLQFSINNINLGSPFTASAGLCAWNQFFEIWNSGINTSAQICIVNQNTIQDGNDFALDDISMVPVCADTATLTIVVSKPAVAAVATHVSCTGQGGKITASVQNGAPPYLYSLNNGATSQTNAVFSNVAAGTYTVLVTDHAGCTATTTVTVGPAPNFNGSVSVTQPTCGLPNGFIIVTANQNGTQPYSYSLNGGTSQSNNVFGSLAPGNYTVSVVDSTGCSFSLNGITLNTSQPLLADLIVLQQPNCADNTGKIQVINLQNAAPPVHYSLNGGTPGTSAEFDNLSAGTDSVLVSDNAGCTVTKTVNLQALDSLKTDLTTVDTRCGLGNGSINLTVTHASGSYSVSLNGQDKGNQTNFPSLASGTYTLVVKDAAGCLDTTHATVKSSTPLFVKIELPKGKDLCKDTVVLKAPAGTIWVWSTGSHDQSISVTKGGIYSVSVQDAQECTATDSLKIEPCNVFIMPNAFTPNNDGLNDTFGPIGAGVIILDLKIYNRWGKLVFEDTKPWDGTYNGFDHPSDVLVYQIKVRTSDGMVHDQHGQVTLFR
jgi:gliding motility-associated-like protein